MITLFEYFISKRVLKKTKFIFNSMTKYLSNIMISEKILLFDKQLDSFVRPNILLKVNRISSFLR